MRSAEAEGRLIRRPDVGVYLDVTGLGTFRIADVPSWYLNLTEKERWAAQAAFWEAVAKVCARIVRASSPTT